MGWTFNQQQVSKIGNFFHAWSCFSWCDQTPVATLANIAGCSWSSITFTSDNHSWFQFHLQTQSLNHLRCTKTVHTQGPFETIPSCQKPYLNHVEKGHMRPVYIQVHINPVKIIKQTQTNSTIIQWTSKPDRLYAILGWIHSNSTMTSPWQPSTAKRLQRTGLNGLRCCHKGIRTEAEDLGKICGKSTFFCWRIQNFDGKTARLHFVWWEHHTLW